jgi:Xaa-Pro aminopeptidase
MDYLTQRRQALLRLLKKDSTDGILVTNPVNVTYLTGFTGDSSYLIVTSKQMILVSDSRFEQQITEECSGFEVHIRPHDKTTPEAAAELLSKTGAKNIALESQSVTLGLYEHLKEKAAKVTFVPLGGMVESLRAIKDPSELEQVRKAVNVAERAFQMFRAMIRETDSEKDMADALETYIRRAGARCSSFPPIVAVGERGALPHAPPTSRTLIEGSKLLIDWGADLLYKSDITRTLKSPFGTAPTRRNKQERVGYHFDEIYDWVLKAHEAAVATLRAGVPAKEVDAAARATLAKAKFRDHPDLKLETFFTHGLGHGIGLEVHELPRIRSNSTDVLEAGMIVTIEPGVYLPEWGGVRIEDDYLITKEGANRLTTLPRDPSAIG